MGFTGWYRDPSLQALFWVVVIIEIAVLVWGLRHTAREGRAYGAQVGAGTLMALFGGVIIFIGSIIFTTVVFPQYFQELRVLGEETLRSQGLSEEELTTTLDQTAAFQTPFVSALMGFLFTIVTGVLASLVIAVFARKKA
jgi:hypothetical protein